MGATSTRVLESTQMFVKYSINVNYTKVNGN